MVKSIIWDSSYLYNETIFIPFGYAPLLKDNDLIYGLCSTHDIIEWNNLKNMSKILEDLYKKVEEENNLILVN